MLRRTWELKESCWVFIFEKIQDFGCMSCTPGWRELLSDIRITAHHVCASESNAAVILTSDTPYRICKAAMTARPITHRQQSRNRSSRRLGESSSLQPPTAGHRDARCAARRRVLLQLRRTTVSVACAAFGWIGGGCMRSTVLQAVLVSVYRDQ